MSHWTLLSNHGHVLVCLSRDPEARLRDVAADVGITERAVQKIVRDLQDGGMISVSKSGRRNCYRIHRKQSMRHELEAGCTLQDLIRVANKSQETQLPETGSGKNTEAELQSRSEPPGGVVDTGPEPDTMPAMIQPDPAKPKADIHAGTGESKFSDSFEKQQGSLF